MQGHKNPDHKSLLEKLALSVHECAPKNLSSFTSKKRNLQLELMHQYLESIGQRDNSHTLLTLETTREVETE